MARCSDRPSGTDDGRHRARARLPSPSEGASCNRRPNPGAPARHRPGSGSNRSRPLGQNGSPPIRGCGALRGPRIRAAFAREQALVLVPFGRRGRGGATSIWTATHLQLPPAGPRTSASLVDDGWWLAEDSVYLVLDRHVGRVRPKRLPRSGPVALRSPKAGRPRPETASGLLSGDTVAPARRVRGTRVTGPVGAYDGAPLGRRSPNSRGPRFWRHRVLEVGISLVVPGGGSKTRRGAVGRPAPRATVVEAVVILRGPDRGPVSRPAWPARLSLLAWTASAAPRRSRSDNRGSRVGWGCGPTTKGALRVEVGSRCR